MNDDALTELWTTMDSTDRRAMDARVSAWLEAHDTSIAAEWLQLFAFSPVRALGLLTASAISIAMPFVAWIAGALR